MYPDGAWAVIGFAAEQRTGVVMHNGIKASCVFVAVMLLHSTPLLADSKEKPEPCVQEQPLSIETLTQQVEEIIDAVLAHHINPPTRQEMWLAGAKAMLARVGATQYGGLSAEISQMTTPAQFSAFLNEFCASEVFLKDRQPAPDLEQAFISGLLTVVPGATDMIPRKELKVQEQVQGN